MYFDSFEVDITDLFKYISIADIRNCKSFKLAYDQIKAWCTLNYYTIDDIKSQPLFCNSHIRIANVPHWPRKSIRDAIPNFTAILHSTQKRLLTFQELQNKIGSEKLNCLEYFSIKSAIPKSWVSICALSLKAPSSNTNVVTKINKGIKPTKLFYSTKIQTKPNKFTNIRYKWEQILQKEIPDSFWCNQVTCINSYTKSTKLRAFQYRLINFAIITNIQLCKWSLIPSDKCSFCHNEPETYKHLFVNCRIVKNKVWIPLKRWLDHFCFINIDISDEYLILLNRYKDVANSLTNMIILITKQYIYAKRCLNENLNAVELMHSISQYRLVEHIVANRSHNTKIYQEFVNKWALYDLV